MVNYFDFEKEVVELDKLIDEIKDKDPENKDKLFKLITEKDQLLQNIYANLNAWQKVQVSRHNARPHTKDFINNIFNDVVFLHGDKKYADDYAVIGGFGEIDGKSVMILGTEKGNSMETRIKHNFGMAKPEGYRKAQRLMKLAEKFKLPIIILVDTAGAFPGKDAEERGQSESIASSISTSLNIKTQMISIIIGEGGSGGAIALATTDKVLMLENSIYSVISPEGCASILWRNKDFSQDAAESLKLTAQDCFEYKIIDQIIKEVPGGAHRNISMQSKILKDSILKNLIDLNSISIDELVKKRKDKFLNITSQI